MSKHISFIIDNTVFFIPGEKVLCPAVNKTKNGEYELNLVLTDPSTPGIVAFTGTKEDVIERLRVMNVDDEHFKLLDKL